MFCKCCGNLLDLPNNSEFISCNLCNASHQCKDFENIRICTKSRPGAFGGGRKVEQLDGEEDDIENSGAIIEEKCQKCGHDRMRFFTLQLRSSDEGQTVFYTCVKCK